MSGENLAGIWREFTENLKRIRGDPNIQTSTNTDTSALPVPCAKTGFQEHVWSWYEDSWYESTAETPIQEECVPCYSDPSQQDFSTRRFRQGPQPAAEHACGDPGCRFEVHGKGVSEQDIRILPGVLETAVGPNSSLQLLIRAAAFAIRERLARRVAHGPRRCGSRRFRARPWAAQFNLTR